MRTSLAQRNAVCKTPTGLRCLQRRVVPAARVPRALLKDTNPSKDENPISSLQELAKRIAAAALGITTALSLLLSPALAASELVRLPASTDPAVFAAQRTLVEAWTIVGQAFVDPSFNGHDWESELREHMMTAFNAANPDAAFGEIGHMLEELGDPYTRRIPPEEYAAFRVSSEGELQGVGMLIANEPINGHLLVLAPIKGGPADRAGILPGDEVTSINGMSMEGWNGEKAARLLRGKGGTEVRVRLARRTGGIPGVPARPEPPPSVEYREVSLRRERVQLSPLFYAALPPPALPPGTGAVMPVGSDGRVRQPDGPVGYLRLTSFSSNAAAEMRDAIQELEAAGASSYILDLRNNPGGLVRSSIDIARLWLDGSPVVFNISSREPGEVQSQLVDTPGSALTHRPLVVLVNGASASASEILSGALHDNHRALIVGDGHTYGKGKIQSVFELQDGSALFVTVARYQTPNGTEIDRVGINPDRSCALPGSSSSSSASGSGEGGGSGSSSTYVAGLPMVPGTETALLESLAGDSCVAVARAVLKDEVAVVANAARVAVDIVRPVGSSRATLLPPPA
ncbi:hypothetical protein PLESTB_000106100 [Pleodorina starrii]|uniref:PDZ domain-containing protein n=1 Tax=Pleodorina starrii TaxID=330485 RepID=A0A9W6BAF5_9CHLO|nr:hypothetical protein PLESTM_000102500 [Pleodorina starrii]GLC48512.1 hypothetical protein PLESTB_000106100 [Pleodorina starrii]GLC71831.1 hypothetical protein PLESTF_001171800 [Pleodorina starrii]